MKKMITVIALLLVLALLCCGCAPKTPEEVVERMNEALEETPCSQMEMDMSFTMAMDMGELGSMEMDMALGMDMTVCQDPVGMYMNMTVDMGMAGTSLQTTAENYVVLEGDKLVSYTGAEGEWVKQESEETLESLTEQMSALDLTGAEIVIDDTVTEWEGTKAICLTFQVTGDSVEDTLGGMMGSTDSLGDLGDVDWSAMSCEGRIYVDAKTYLPLAEEITINGMGEAMASAYEGTGVAVDVEGCTANVVFVSYEPQGPIELPAEASGAVEY